MPSKNIKKIDRFKAAKIYWYLIIVVSIFYCYEFFLRISPGLVMNQLLIQYHTHALGIAEFASFYYFAYMFAQVPAGMLFDRYSVKTVLNWAILVCIIGTLIFTTSHTITLGLLGRAIIGIGSAFAFVGALYVTKRYLPSKYFTTVTSLVISLGTLAGAFGQVFAANIIHAIGWQQSIFGIALLGFIIIMAIAAIPNRYLTCCNPTEIRLPGSAIVHQAWQLLKNKTIWINGVIGGLFYLPTSIFAATWGITFLTNQYDISKTQASFSITLIFLGWAIGAPIIGILCDRLQLEKWLLVIGALLASLTISLILYSPQLPFHTINLLLFAFGFTSSAQVIVWRIFHKQIKNDEVIGTASALTNMIIIAGGAIFQLVVGWLIDAIHQPVTGETVPHYTTHDLKLALIILPISLLLTAILGYWLNRHLEQVV